MANKPELVVAIDFGMTCTGVAYCNLNRSQNVLCMQKWDGRGQANENKVPTVVTYEKSTNRLVNWGFLSENRFDQTSPDREYCQWFKTCVDEKHYQSLRAQSPPAGPPSQHHVDRWTEDYLRSLYGWISTRLEHELPPGKRWDQTRIEVVFSVPTTWEPQTTVVKFKNIALRAGWGSSSYHNVSIGLTEAEAAAVYVACEAAVIFNENDNLLVADCGGGTTDLNILRVTGVLAGIPQLKQLNVVEGKAVGSTQIDIDFEELVFNRLQQANAVIPIGIDLEATAWAMMKSAQFLNAKCCFGEADDADFRVAIPDLGYHYSNPQFGIQNGHMHFRLIELQYLFDKQISSLLALIDHQLTSFAASHPGQQIGHLILSGGLSNNLYVQRRLKERYAMNVDNFSNARNLKVQVSSEPQLAVCRGICLDKVKGLQAGKAILNWRCCRASYGTDCKIPYNDGIAEHIGKKTKRDDLDGIDYITNGVAWFIKKGESIDVSKPKVQQFTRKITPGDPRRTFSDKGAGAEELCRITCDLSSANEKKFKLKNRHWWQSGAKYLRVQYEVRVVMGAADIAFELWFDGQKVSRSDAIAVEWLAADAPEQTTTVDDAAVLVSGASTNGHYGSNSFSNNGFGPHGSSGYR